VEFKTLECVHVDDASDQSPENAKRIQFRRKKRADAAAEAEAAAAAASTAEEAADAAAAPPAEPPPSLQELMTEAAVPAPQTIDPAAIAAGAGVLMKLIMSHEYPAAPPRGFFLTKIYHPNIDKIGMICISFLKNDGKGEN
jgi:hypothetical protein